MSSVTLERRTTNVRLVIRHLLWLVILGHMPLLTLERRATNAKLVIRHFPRLAI